MWWYRQLLLKLFFQDILKLLFQNTLRLFFQDILRLLFQDNLRMICHIDFKCYSIDFHKQRMQPAKYQHLGIGPSTSFQISFCGITILLNTKQHQLRFPLFTMEKAVCTGIILGAL